MRIDLKSKGVLGVITNVIIAVVLISVLGVTLYAVTPANDKAKEASAIYSGSENSGSVALMFNVYQGTEQALKIANLLVEHGFCATFFVGGKWVERNGTAIMSLYNMGMEIGNHGYLHRDHKTISYEKNIDEIALCEKVVDAYLKSFDGYKNSKLFAPPSGSFGGKMFDACDTLGYKVIMWTRDTIDWRDQDPDVIFARAVKDIKAGDLVLMHPTDATLTALPRILEYIKEIGLKVGTVSSTLS